MSGMTPPTYDAYKEFSAGISLFGPDYPGAIGHFRRAAAIDTSFVAPSIYIMFCYTNTGRYAEADSLQRMLANKRSRLTPYEALWVDVVSTEIRGNQQEQLKLLRQLDSVEPGNFIIKHMIAGAALALNRPREALAAISALEAHPEAAKRYTGSWSYGRLANILHLLGEYDQELRVAREARRAYPEVIWLRGREAQALVGLTRFDELAALIDETLASPEFGTSTPAGVMD